MTQEMDKNYQNVTVQMPYQNKMQQTGKGPNKMEGLDNLMGDVDKLLSDQNIAEQYKQKGGQ